MRALTTLPSTTFQTMVNRKYDKCVHIQTQLEQIFEEASETVNQCIRIIILKPLTYRPTELGVYLYQGTRL